MRHLLRNWGEVVPRLSRASKIALFLDFDGTLAPIRPTPQEVTFQAPLRKALAELSRSPRFYIWVISGRRRSDIRDRIGLRGIRYLGLHGWEGRCMEALPEASSMALAGVKSWAGGLFANSANIWIEDKGLSVAIHHHETSPPGPPVEAMLESMVEPFKDVLRIAPAKNVHEVLPLELGDKGAAVKHQMAAVCNQALPIYVGDDSIDEPAFVALRRGLTVRVGRARRSKARYRLSGVAEVQRFLERLGSEFA
jgi:trehalose 6-phosphate phosphatase